MGLPFKDASLANNMGRGLTSENDLRLVKEACARFASAIKLAQKPYKEVIKMAEEEKREDSGRMAMAKTAIQQKLALLDAELQKLRAERNAVARALRGLGKFY